MNKLLFCLRYCILFLSVGSIYIMDSSNIGSITNSIPLVLLYIILDQLRFFMFLKKSLPSFIIILLQLGVAYLLCNSFNGIFLLFIITPIIDGIMFFTTLYMSITLIICTVLLTFSQKWTGTENIILFMAFLLTSFYSSYYMRFENRKKLYAQDLYDKLRIYEEKLKEANKDLESYANTIEEVTLLRERTRMSRELHDSVGHSLSAIIFQLGAIEKSISPENSVPKNLSSNLVKYSQETLSTLRETIKKLKPLELSAHNGLLSVQELINNFSKLTGIEIDYKISHMRWSFTNDLSVTLYRIIQEFMTNSLKHGDATNILIAITFDNSSLNLFLKDNGIGNDNFHEGFGLNGIKERASLLGGIVTFSSKKDEGFEASISFPKEFSPNTLCKNT